METRANSIKLGIYKHRNGNLYRIIGMGCTTNTLEEYVVYQALYADFGIWIRPYAEFIGTVSIDEKEVPRFTYVCEGTTHAPACERR